LDEDDQRWGSSRDKTRKSDAHSAFTTSNRYLFLLSVDEFEE